ncbi:Putative DNA-binding domain-containing protein [Rhizobium sp. RU20A]|uniref:HvfC/BufC N-terminal domain-containing protein n=1 Tax=Rhizobium sp. RU20A TaxID=1907412 RepID=UPI000956B1A4|nr:DNA-binding domain-containing protein [Rhizobium sp. RU20A]SIQ10850.1 Putative DNA-binding domain-containing protein [Rhizobium sp. RU20A]
MMEPHADPEIYDAFAGALLSPEADLPAGLSSWTGKEPQRRFGVYRNNVAHSLVSALESRFPVARRIVGEAFFAGLAQAFIRVSPPRSPLLMVYGDTLADFVADFPPAAGVPYLADVLRLEAARGHAYHAADLPVLDPAVLAALPPDALAGVRLVPHPALRLVASTHPVHTVWAMNREGETPQPIADWQGEAVAIARPGLVVETHCLAPGVGVFLGALASGEPLALAAGAAAASDARFDLQAAFGLMLAGGFFAGLAGEGGSTTPAP